MKEQGVQKVHSAEPLWREVYPFTSHEMAIDRWRLHYLDEGRGETLLLVHGNPTWSFYWRHLIVALRDRYRLVAPDHLGCGLSDKPRRGTYRLADHIDRLTELIGKLDLRDITLLVHDWGGAIGLGAAVREPDRFRRLVIFNSGAFPPWFVPWRLRVCRWPLLGQWGVRGHNIFVLAALRATMVHPERLSPAELAGYIAPYDSWANRIAVHRFVRDIPVSKRHPTYTTLAEIEQRLPALADRPTQFIWGMQDWCFRPECLEKFLELLPQAEVHRMHDAGHWVVEDAREQIIHLVPEFLERHPRA